MPCKPVGLTGGCMNNTQPADWYGDDDWAKDYEETNGNQND